MPTPRITSFLVKVASRCNLDCDYCYVYHHADQSWRTMPKVLGLRDRKFFSERVAAYCKSQNISRCAVIFHGGEPLLAGTQYLVEFAQELRDTLAPEVQVELGLQTNGILLSAEALVQLEAANIAVSLSSDGPKEANDRHRTSKKGRSSFEKVENAMALLKQHPTIFAGVIAVIDARNDPETLFEFFDRWSPPKLDFLLPDAHHLRQPPGRENDPDLYSRWLINAFDLWLSKYPHIPVRTFEALLDAVAGLPSGTDAFGLGNVSLLSIETDGSYHDLDVLKVVGDGATKLSGNVRDTEIADVAASEAVAAHEALLQKDGLSATCQECDEVETCGGGSLPHRYGTNGFNNPTVYCREMQALIAHIRRTLAGDVLKASPRVYPALPSTMPAKAFEKAEEGTGITSELWSNAETAALAGLTQILEAAVRNQSPHAKEASTLLGLPPAKLARIATRPGTIAWQRAWQSTKQGRAVFAVDGSPLEPSLEYLAFLSNLADEADGELGIGDFDPWLRKPFGTAIAFENEDIAAQARPVTRKALEIVAAWRPELLQEMRQICRTIQFVCDPTAHPDKIVSFSDDTVPGALFVSVRQASGLIDPYDLADSLVHEHRHQKLYLLERQFPMVEQTMMKVVSPWREDLRPPSGLMHAIFVFVELRRFWEHVKTAGPERLHNRAINQLRETDGRLAEGLARLRTCPLTPAGFEMIKALEASQKTPAPAA